MDSSWKQWNGGERPVKRNTYVDVIWGDDITSYGLFAEHLDWQYVPGSVNNIVYYRKSRNQ